MRPAAAGHQVDHSKARPRNPAPDTGEHDHEPPPLPPPRLHHEWRVHSIGIVRGTGTTAGTGTGSAAVDYRMALLSHDNPTMRYGVRTLEGIAVAVHRGLAGSAAARGFTPGERISETPDGSAPRGEPGSHPPAPGGAWPGHRPPEWGTYPGAVPPSRTARARRRAPRRPRSRPSE